MPLYLSYRPLDRPIPPPDGGAKRSLFNAPTVPKAKDRIVYEVSRLQGKEDIHIVLMVDCDEREIRQDGMLRADWRPKSSAAALFFDPHRADIPALRFQCATYTAVGCNLYAISLVLESLRAQRRYGVGSGTEQYRGWSALRPAGGIAATEWASVEQAVRWLGSLVTTHFKIDASKLRGKELLEHVNDLWKAAMRRHHPDAGGDTEEAKRVNRCRDFITREIEEGRA